MTKRSIRQITNDSSIIGMFKLRILQGAPKVLAAKTSAPSTHVPREDILCGKDPIRWARRAHVRKRGAVVEEHLAPLYVLLSFRQFL